MNAISPRPPETAEERTARHLRVCAEMVELGMNLLRAAAARTVTDWAEQDAQPATAAPPTAARKHTDPAAIFIRLTAAIRDVVKLEAHLAAAAPETTPRARRADARRTLVCEAFQIVTKHHPDRRELLREATARIDAELAADPGHTFQPIEVLFTVCDELGIDIDLAILPDKYLGPEPGAGAGAPP